MKQHLQVDFAILLAQLHIVKTTLERTEHAMKFPVEQSLGVEPPVMLCNGFALQPLGFTEHSQNIAALMPKLQNPVTVAVTAMSRLAETCGAILHLLLYCLWAG